MTEEIQYVIVRLDDVQALLKHSNPLVTDPALTIVIDRLKKETGGDIQNIVDELKATHICGACVIQSQEQNCSSLYTNHLGRRLSRLLDRANTGRPEEMQTARNKRKQELKKLRLQQQRISEEIESDKKMITEIEIELVKALQCMMSPIINDQTLIICNKIVEVVMRGYSKFEGGTVSLDNSNPENPNVLVIEHVKRK
jgi:hypothetical protein